MATSVFTSHGQWLDDSLNVLSGGKVYVYDVGTTTPKSVYSDTALSVPAANPIILDSAGRHDNRYIATGSYKIVLKTSADVAVFTRDNNDGGVPVGSGALAIANGGTGATTAAAALAALEGATAAELAEVSAEVASLSGQLASTEKTHIATGTTGQRPATPVHGDIRRNTTTSRLEHYNGSGWEQLFTDTEIASTAQALAGSLNTLVMTPSLVKAANPLQSRYLVCRDVQAAATDAGGFTSGSFVKRVIGGSSAIINNITSATLTSDVISLPAGTYFVRASAPAHEVDAHVLKIRNTTDGSDLLVGQMARATGTGNQTLATVEGYFTIAGTKNIELQHRCGTTKGTNGLGRAGNLGVSEVYAQIILWQVG